MNSEKSLDKEISQNAANVLSECRKCHFSDPIFRNFPGEHAPGPP